VVQIKPKLCTVCIGCDFFHGPFLRLFPENNAHKKSDNVYNYCHVATVIYT